jgi:hypothetical protein
VGVSDFGLNLDFLGVAQDGGNNAHANTILCSCFSRFLHIHGMDAQEPPTPDEKSSI